MRVPTFVEIELWSVDVDHRNMARGTRSYRRKALLRYVRTCSSWWKHRFRPFIVGSIVRDAPMWRDDWFGFEGDNCGCIWITGRSALSADVYGRAHGRWTLEDPSDSCFQLCEPNTSWFRWILKLMGKVCELVRLYLLCACYVINLFSQFLVILLLFARSTIPINYFSQLYVHLFVSNLFLN